MLVSRADLAAHPQPHQLVLASAGALGLVDVVPHRDCVIGGATAARLASPAATAADRRALVHQRGERGTPALALGADPVGVGNPRIGHVDLVELCLTGDLPQRTHFDTLAVHVEREVRHALVFG